MSHLRSAIWLVGQAVQGDLVLRQTQGCWSATVGGSEVSAMTAICTTWQRTGQDVSGSGKCIETTGDRRGGLVYMHEVEGEGQVEGWFFGMKFWTLTFGRSEQ